MTNLPERVERDLVSDVALDRSNGTCEYCLKPTTHGTAHDACRKAALRAEKALDKARKERYGKRTCRRCKRPLPGDRYFYHKKCLALFQKEEDEAHD